MDPRAAPPLSSSLLRRSGYAKAQSALAEALDPNSGAAPPLSSFSARGSSGELNHTFPSAVRVSPKL